MTTVSTTRAVSRITRAAVLVACMTLAAAPRADSGVELTAGRRQQGSEIPNAIFARLSGRMGTDRESLVAASDRLELDGIYTANGYQALWFDGAGRETERVAAVLDLLARAEDDGLTPKDYALTVPLPVQPAAGGAPPDVDAIARADVELSRVLLRFYRDVHLGRVDPRTLGFHIDALGHVHDFSAMVRAAARDGTVTATADALRPALPQYGAIGRALARYRALAADPAVPKLPLIGRIIKPGDAFAERPEVAAFLGAVGDFQEPTGSNGQPLALDAPMVDALIRFQRRHGLTPDGVIGRETAAALNVPLSWRVRQLALALERLRWLPELGPGRLVVVNIPMFRLWAFDAIPGAPVLSMPVVVGRALDTETPVFVDEMSHVVFRPYWNVPRSITRQEMVPLLTRDPDYLTREGFEVVSGTFDAPVVVGLTDDWLRGLANGTFRLRQRPGPTNALGRIKFVFPNAHDIYLHGTPAQQLFAQSRRDFSHGCIRVENPIDLAEWALRGTGNWTRDAIVAATEGADDQRVDLVNPVQIALLYATAAVLPDDGSVLFAVDIYGHDRRLDDALRAERAAEAAGGAQDR